MTTTANVSLELQPAVWGTVPRPTRPVLFSLAKLFLGPVGLLLSAATVAAAGPEKVLVKDAYIMRLEFGVCGNCQQAESQQAYTIGNACLNKLRSDRLGRELFEDFPQTRRVDSV